LLVKYENLRYDTKNELKKIFEFIGIKRTEKELEEIVNKYAFEKIPSAQKGSGKFSRSASPGAWKENLSEEEQKIMNSVLKKTLKKFGYEN